MNFQFPKGFLQGKTVVRVGNRVEEFVKLYNSTFPNNTGYKYMNYDFSKMIERYDDDLAISCNFIFAGEGLGWSSATWYLNHECEVVDFYEPDNQPSVDILDLL